MKARGERIVIFGDSLSHPGMDSGPTQSIVTEGSARRTSAPGDMLGSLLLEQGAEAVMLDAKVSRSAYNYWAREPAQKLMTEVQAFRPTQVIVMLGTNDIGLSLEADKTAFTSLRDAFRAMGAEVWAIGPFAYVGRGASLNPGATGVLEMMTDVFGSSHTIDARPLTVGVDRSSDGIHFTPTSAEGTAANLAQALLAKNPLPQTTWLAIGAGVAGVLGLWGLIAWNRSRGKTLGQLQLPEPPDEEIEKIAADAENVKEKRAIREQLSPESRALLQEKGIHEIKQQAEHDWAHSDGLDLTIEPREAVRKLAAELDQEDWVSQNEDVIDEYLVDSGKAFAAWRESFLERARASARRLEAGGMTALRERRYQADPRVIDAVFTERPELEGVPLQLSSGLGDAINGVQPPKEKRGATPEEREERDHVVEKMWELMRDPDPAAMAVAEDAALQHGIRLREFGMSPSSTTQGGRFLISPHSNDATAPSTYVAWSVEPFSQGPGQIGFWTEMAIVLDDQKMAIRSVPDDDVPPRSIRDGVETIRTFEPRSYPTNAEDTLVNLRFDYAVLSEKETRTSPQRTKLKRIKRQIEELEKGPQTTRELDALREKATKAAVADAWRVAKIIKSYGDPKVHPRAREAALREQIAEVIKAPRRWAPDEPKELFGASSSSTEQGYRVAYGLVTRRDGEIVTVRSIVDAPRALTLPEAEKWRRKYGQGATAWVETMDGTHVPVKGAKRPGSFVDDARPGDVHATMTADYAKPA